MPHPIRSFVTALLFAVANVASYGEHWPRPAVPPGIP